LKSTVNLLPDARVWLWLSCIALAVAVFYRAGLDQRPVHTDEAVNAVITAERLENGTYQYDPHDRHGPSLSWLESYVFKFHGVKSLSQMDSATLRLSSVFTVAATVLILGLLPEFISGATMASALLLALGAPFVFYGRYGLHEPILIFSTLLLIGSLSRFWLTGHLRWALLVGLSAGLAICTKESALISFLCLGLSYFILVKIKSTRTTLMNLKSNLVDEKRVRFSISLVILVISIVTLLGYSSMGQNPSGFYDFFKSLPLLTHRAAGSGHEKPWFTYITWLIKPTELSFPFFGWIVLLFGAVGAVRSFLPNSTASLIQFLVIYGLLILTIYSLTPYKTPWLMLEFLLPAVVVAGYGMASIWNFPENKPNPILQRSVTLLTLFLLIRQTDRLCFRYQNDSQNPFCYSGTSPDLERLSKRLDYVASLNQTTSPFIIAVVSKDYWPLPWYLRQFNHVGYFTELPDHLNQNAVISSLEEAQRIAQKLGKTWTQEFIGQRQDMLLVLFTPEDAHRG